jgi:hypothetical protein
VPREELAEVAQRYKKLAGFDKDRLNALRPVETRLP